MAVNSLPCKKTVRTTPQQLVKDGVSLHVCGTYAEKHGLHEEDFPEYVNVAAAGPAQINDYIAVGYLRIKIEKPVKR
jgi:intracellular sulfur oxidation DsrE/DsrF family protein